MSELLEWISTHHGPDWAVVIIAPDLDMVYISEYNTFRGRVNGPYSLAGIHVRDLLVVADLEVEDWMPSLVKSLTTSVGAKHVSYSNN